MKRNGPRVTLELSCFDCAHEHSESYAVQGDSGHDVSCKHPSLVAPKRVGDTAWRTPVWCPERAAALKAATAELLTEPTGATTPKQEDSPDGR